MNSRISSRQLTHHAALDMLKRQAELAKTQAQLSSGKRINNPSDDPAHASRLRELEQSVSRLEQFNRNADSVEARLALEETTLTSVIDTFTRLRELSIAANNATLDADSHAAILAETESHLDALYDLANTRDGTGRYLFSGTSTSTLPFTRNSPVVDYLGSDAEHHLQIGSGRLMQTSDAGSTVFLGIPSGNGSFAAATAPGNTGSGVIVENSVTDKAQFNGDSYSLVFTGADSFDIVNDTTGNTVQSGVSYASNNIIEFDGRSVTISGAPKAGDTFTVTPSESLDAFNIVDRFNQALALRPVGVAEQAQQRQGFTTAIAEIDSAIEQLSTLRGRVGSRLKSVEMSREETDSSLLQLNTTRADIEDLDMAEAITRLQSQANSLEVLQKSYLRIQNLSLFDYL